MSSRNKTLVLEMSRVKLASVRLVIQFELDTNIIFALNSTHLDDYLLFIYK